MGLSDAKDGGGAFRGAMRALINLVPDPTTAGLWVPRPAANILVASGQTRAVWGSFLWGGALWSAGGASPAGLVTCCKVVGGFVYGMIGNGSGADIPFAFNLANNQFVPISGITPANSPTSPAATGAWNPPQMVQVGAYLVVTHPGFNFGGGYAVGWLNIANPSAPVWSAGNLTTTPLPALPVGVSQMSDRAYFIVGNAVQASDAGNPTVCTNNAGSQVLTVGSALPLTAIGGLPLSSLLGGIVQAIILFKGAKSMWQVTGDPTSNWTLNEMQVATGTLAPNTITPTPNGLGFVSPDGLRFVNFDGSISDPVGNYGRGVTLPFINSVVPSRMCAAYAADTIRIGTQNGNKVSEPWEEYWYHLSAKVWSGPHSNAAALMDGAGTTFYTVPQVQNPMLCQSDVRPNLTSSYVENGAGLAWNYAPVLLPEQDDLNMNACVEATLQIAIPGGVTINVAASDEGGALLNQVNLINANQASPVWGDFLWGSVAWGTSSSLMAWQIPWSQPIVFNQVALSVSGPSSAAIKIGAMHLMYQKLGYVAPQAAVGGF